METTPEPSESYWHSTINFHLIPGKTFGTQWWFIGFSVIGYLLSLYYLTKFMEKRPPYKMKTFALIHKFFFIINYKLGNF